MGDHSKDLIGAVKAAYQRGTPLNLIGGNSKAFYGNAATGEPLVLTEHSGIIDYDPAELVMVARAGTPLTTIIGTLAEHHQMLGFEPPYADLGATIGGAVAAGLSGPRRPYAGAVRDFMLGVNFINGKGELVKAGGKVIKNVAGFDLFRPMAGAMGTLGVLLDVSLRVVPIPAAENTVMLTEANESHVLAEMTRWATGSPAVSGACWDGETIRVRLSGSLPGVESACEQIGGDVIESGSFWSDLNNQRLAFFDDERPLWRFSLPATAAPMQIEGAHLIDWGGAQRWLYSHADANEIRQQAVDRGGHATLYLGGDRKMAFHPLPETLRNVHLRVKQALDPKGIFNPNRMGF